MRVVFFIIFIFLSSVLFAQTVLFEQDVKGDTLKETRGPNMKHYSHGFIDYGLFVQQSSSNTANVSLVESGEFGYGFRYKRRLSNFYSVGYDVSYNYLFYKMQQSGTKAVPDTMHYSKEYLRFHYMGVGLYNRFNFGRRGNVLGKYIDLGVYGSLCLSSSHVMKNRYVAGANYRHNKIVEKNLKYIQAYQYGVVARVGVNRYILHVKYRLSDLFKPSYNFPELPSLLIGLQVGLF